MLNLFRVLGIPNGPLPVTGTDEFQKSISISKLRKILGLTARSAMFSMSALQQMVHDTKVDTLESQERFLSAFLICVVGNFLAPRGGYQRVHPDVYPAIANPLKSVQFNWCSYVYDELRTSAQRVKHSLVERLPVPLHGCVLVLLVLYWDSLPVCRSLIIEDETAPRGTLYNLKVIAKITEMDPAITKIDKCRAFFEMLPSTQQDECTDGRRRKRTRARTNPTSDSTEHTSPIVSGEVTLRPAQHGPATTSHDLASSSSSAGEHTECELAKNIVVHKFGFQALAIQPSAAIMKINCSNWLLEICNPSLGPHNDASAALSFWVSSTEESSEYYWNWIEHSDHRTIAILGDTFKSIMMNTLPFNHDFCEIATRLFRKHEKISCTNPTNRPCRHFLSPDWARFVLSDVIPERDDHFSRMFSVDYTTYTVANCQMVSTLVELEKQWACYIWDFPSRRLTIIDPQLRTSTLEEVKVRHCSTSAILHSHFLLCMEIYYGTKRKDILDWEVVLLGDIIPSPNSDLSALYALYYSLEFDGESIRVPPTHERINHFKTALMYQILHIEDNAGKLPKINIPYQ
ncbi:unnamed protein product [Urochloa humidicola]